MSLDWRYSIKRRTNGLLSRLSFINILLLHLPTRATESIPYHFTLVLIIIWWKKICYHILGRFCYIFESSGTSTHITQSWKEYKRTLFCCLQATYLHSHHSLQISLYSFICNVITILIVERYQEDYILQEIQSKSMAKFAPNKSNNTHLTDFLFHPLAVGSIALAVAIGLGALFQK